MFTWTRSKCARVGFYGLVSLKNRYKCRFIVSLRNHDKSKINHILCSHKTVLVGEMQQQSPKVMVSVRFSIH